MQNSSSAFSSGDLSGIRVLVAEDESLLADTIAVLLEEEGARVLGPFGTTQRACERANSERIDFALVDMGLKDTFSDPLLAEISVRDIPRAVIIGFDFLPTNVSESDFEFSSRSPSARRGSCTFSRDLSLAIPFDRRGAGSLIPAFRVGMNRTTLRLLDRVSPL